MWITWVRFKLEKLGSGALLYVYNFNVGLPYPVIASKWFICIFAEVLPVETVLRIWDCVFAEGYKIVFRAANNITKHIIIILWENR